MGPRDLGCATVQRDLNGLEKQANGNPVKFDKEKCKFLYLGRNNPMHQYGLEPSQLASSSAEKDLGGAGEPQVGHEPAMHPHPSSLSHSVIFVVLDMVSCLPETFHVTFSSISAKIYQVPLLSAG